MALFHEVLMGFVSAKNFYVFSPLVEGQGKLYHPRRGNSDGNGSAVQNRYNTNIRQTVSPFSSSTYTDTHLCTHSQWAFQSSLTLACHTGTHMHIWAIHTSTAKRPCSCSQWHTLKKETNSAYYFSSGLNGPWETHSRSTSWQSNEYFVTNTCLLRVKIVQGPHQNNINTIICFSTVPLIQQSICWRNRSHLNQPDLIFLCRILPLL